MRPYRRKGKPVRHRDCFFKESHEVLHKMSMVMVAMLSDLKTIWKQDRPFPTFAKLLLTGLLIWILILPFLYIFVPPFITLVSYYSSKGEDVSSWLEVPEIHLNQKLYINHFYKMFVKRTTFRLSMLITMYDYLQMFRNIGYFGGGTQ